MADRALTKHNMVFSPDETRLAIVTATSSGAHSARRGLGRRHSAPAARLPGPEGCRYFCLPPRRPDAHPRGWYDTADLAARSAECSRRAGRPHGRGLGGGLLARRQGPGHRQRRHPRASDDQALGPGFRSTPGGLEGPHGHGLGARVQPRRTDARLREPGFRQAGASQRHPLGRAIRIDGWRPWRATRARCVRSPSARTADGSPPPAMT